MGSTRPHVLVLPFPSPGHINPMLSLSIHLALRGSIITFMNTSQAQERINLHTPTPPPPNNHIPLIRFHTIPGPYQPPLPPTRDVSMGHAQIAPILAAIQSQTDAIQQLIIDSRSSPHPISCIVADSFFPWTQPLAEKLGIQRILFWTTNGMSLASILEMKSGLSHLLEDLKGPSENDIVVGGVKVKASGFLAMLPATRDPKFIEHFVARLEGIERTTCIVANTFEELEHSSLKASVCETAVRYIGPLAPPSLDNTITANFFQEEAKCLDWLDQQDPGSVLYISFGSVASMEQDQIHELAIGIEASNRPFIWVVRDSLPNLPKEFVERTSTRGLVIRWAPQLRVLGHSSVGGFLTHCGWNSTLEGIHTGVPMLCLPCFGDQFLNALLIEEVWKVGVTLHKGEDGRISGDEVGRGITRLMQSQDIKERASRWKLCAERAINQGGTSHLAIESIFADLLKGVQEKTLAPEM